MSESLEIVTQAPVLTLQGLEAQVQALQARVDGLEAQLASRTPVSPVAAQVAPVAVAAAIATAAPADDQGTIAAQLTKLFAIAARSNPENANSDAALAEFEDFRALVHVDRKNSPLLNQELYQYKWRVICRRYAQYLTDIANPASFQITTQVPAVIDARTETVRVFLRADKRMPVPVLFRRDPTQASAFRIDQSSL